MKSFNLYNSKIFKVLDYIFRLVLINLMIVIPSFLIVYLFSVIFKDNDNIWFNLIALIPLLAYFYPSICASTDLIAKYELKQTKLVFKEFFKSLKKVYLKALIETIFLSFIVLLFYNSVTFFYRNIGEGIIYIFGFALTIAFIALLFCIIVHLPLVMSYMEGLNIWQDIKLATIMAFKDLPITLAIVVTFGFSIFLSILYDTYFVIGGVSLPLYVLVKMTFKKYYAVYIRTHEK